MISGERMKDRWKRRILLFKIFFVYLDSGDKEIFNRSLSHHLLETLESRLIDPNSKLETNTIPGKVNWFSEKKKYRSH